MPTPDKSTPAVTEPQPISKMTQEELAKSINSKIYSMLHSFKSSVTAAMEVGDLLIEAKKRVGHGNFEAWLGTHCQLSFRTARRYMGMAKNRTKIEAELNAKSANLAEIANPALLALPTSGGGSHGGSNDSDRYDKWQEKLIETLKKLDASSAEAAAVKTIDQITEVVAVKTGTRWKHKAA